MKQRPIDILSNDNSLFCTEQCNNHCLMCCQPPAKTDDIDSLFKENLKRVNSASKELSIIGITGGEPTLMKEKLIQLVHEIRTKLPETYIHILTNGRNLKDHTFAQELVNTGEGKIIFGIPIHSDYGKDHDIIAGSIGAFDETMVGLYNLASMNAAIELRIVMNKMNYRRFLEMSYFIHKNIPFVNWVAFMGMEYTGFTINNYKHIWVEPQNYINELESAIKFLSQWKYNVSIYNIPLCLLPESLHEFAQKSISDWKDTFLSCCTDCSVKEKCCGIFSTSLKPYEGIHSI